MKNWYWQMRAPDGWAINWTGGHWTRTPRGTAGADYRPATPAEAAELNAPTWWEQNVATAFGRRLNRAQV